MCIVPSAEAVAIRVGTTPDGLEVWEYGARVCQGEWLSLGLLQSSPQRWGFNHIPRGGEVVVKALSMHSCKCPSMSAEVGDVP